MMEFVQRISQQLLEPADHSSGAKEYVVLGETYRSLPTDQGDDASHMGSSGFLNSFLARNESLNPDFLADVYSKLHFTYRTKFVPIPRAADGPSPLSFHFLVRENPLATIENAIYNPDCFNTDIGWGCMIRTGQSLLGNALQIARLGRDYRVHQGRDEEEYEIIDWFVDSPDAHFSLHNFVVEGLNLSNKKPGEWFGPAATSRSIQSLLHRFPASGIDRCLISVSSGDVYEDEVKQIFAEKEDARVLLLLGVKLGVDSVNEYYWDDVKRILASNFSVGIAGGRPSSSLYFIGYQGDELIYFDPHTPQPSLQFNASKTFYETCHTTGFGKLLMSGLDPSMLIGILLCGEDHWSQWKEEIGCSKILNVLDTRPRDVDVVCDADMESMDSSVSDAQNDHGTLVDGDYVDIKAVLKHSGGFPGDPDDPDEDFQDVQCKKQQIMVMGDRSFSCNSGDFEVERILVEQDTIHVARSN